jgi:hypothetical protein
LLLRWLHGLSSCSKPGHAAFASPYSSESWHYQTCPVPATPRNAMFWTRRASASKSARCATWRLTVVLISLVQGCYHDLWQWPVLGLHPGSLDRWYSAAFPASWLYGFAAETVLGRSQRSTFSSLWWQSRATGKHGIRQTGQQQFSWRRRAAWPLG